MIRLAVRCRPELAERVLAELVELSPGGVEEQRGDRYVELAIYGPRGELPELPELEAVAGDALIGVTSTEVADDWAERWREFHGPVSIAGGRIVVRPPWSAADHEGIDIVIDPGHAFGTGAHATTRLCLELLLDLAGASVAAPAPALGPLVDLGTGSGVLAIAAAKLGWPQVVGVDSEEAALDAARANATANGVELELRRANLRREPPPTAEAMTANLTAPLLLEVAARLESTPRAARPKQPPRALICSGMLAGEADGVAEAFGSAGLAAVDRRAAGEWVALHLAPHPVPRSG